MKRFCGKGVVAVMLTVILAGCSYIQKARESELKTSMSSLMAAQKSYFKEFGRYSENLNTIGYSPENLSSQLNIYLNAESVPAHISKKLNQEQLPFVKKESFQILGVYDGGKEPLIIFIQKNDQPLERVEL